MFLKFDFKVRLEVTYLPPEKLDDDDEHKRYRGSGDERNSPARQGNAGSNQADEPKGQRDSCTSKESTERLTPQGDAGPLRLGLHQCPSPTNVQSRAASARSMLMNSRLAE